MLAILSKPWYPAPKGNFGLDLIAELQASSLGSRLKRLSEMLYQDYSSLYEYAGVPFKPIWFLVANYLTARRHGSITEIATALHVTHAHIHQVAAQMIQHGIVEQYIDPADRRRRVIRLTKLGVERVAQAMPVWDAIRCAQEQLITESGVDILQIIERLEIAVQERSIFERASILLTPQDTD